MAIRGDSAGLEKSYLLDMLRGDGGRILEIGCGDGRLTRKYAGLATQVVGIDLPSTLPRDDSEPLPESVHIASANGVALPFRDGSFDQAIFSLSF